MRGKSFIYASLFGLCVGCNAGVGAGGQPQSQPQAGDPVGSAGERTAASGPADRSPDAPPGRTENSVAPYPIILAHGMFGFKTIDLVKLRYFNGVADDLASIGETQVYEPVVPFLASSETRAKVLAAYIDDVLAKTGKAKVNIVGHSQGGLDARYLVSTLGYGDRVASITTLSTPHHGSRVADAILGLAPDLAYALVQPLLKLYGDLASNLSDPNLHESLISLSEDYVERVFNPQNPDDPRVAYYSWAGRSLLSPGDADCDGGTHPNNPSITDNVDPLFVVFGGFLNASGKPAHPVNDGLVPVHSSKHGMFMGCIPADHLDEVGLFGGDGTDQNSKFDHRTLFREVVWNMRANGF
jgi:triacylglycerol lipase